MKTLPTLAVLALSLGAAFAEPLSIKVQEATVGSDHGQPVLNLTLDPAAATAFADFTKANVGKQVELRVDGRTMLSARLMDPILGGKIQVSGSNRSELTDVADRIAAGAAKVEVEASAN